MHSPIFAYLSPQQLACLSQVNRQIYFKVSAYMHDAYTLEPRLALFFPDPVAFRRMQARTRCLISGDFALLYFTRQPTSSLLDLYVHDHQRRELGRWLLAEAGFGFLPSNRQSVDFETAVLQRVQRTEAVSEPSSVAAMFVFIKQGRHGNPLVVRVHVGRDTPMAVILRSCSSKFWPFPANT